MTSLESLRTAVYASLVDGLDTYRVTVLKAGLPAGKGTRGRPQIGFRFVGALHDFAELELIVQASGTTNGETAVYKYADLVDAYLPGQVNAVDWTFDYDQDDAVWRAIGTTEAARSWPTG